MKFILCVSLALVALSQASVSKINKDLLQGMRENPTNTIIVSFGSTQKVLDAVAASFTKTTTKAQRVQSVARALMDNAEKSQKSVLEFLSKAHQGKVTPLWITNQVSVEGATNQLIHALSIRPDVVSIEKEVIVTLDTKVESVQEGREPRAEWGIEMIGADDAWAIAGGNAGEGALIGIIDTGCRGTHNDLAENYVGNQNFGWMDPYGSSPNPRDGHGHGTHVTGTICGKNGIGVAPNAKWMSCMGLNDNGSGGTTQLVQCGQHMACPGGNTGNCGMYAPDAVSNSWGSTGTGQTFFDGVINSWRTAGIIPVFAAGNSGSSCNTILYPAYSTAEAFSVAATDSNNGLASFSSRGPASNNRLNPHIAAPGVNVRSAGHSSDSAYATMSGTSMACPHTAGLTALVRSHDPTISVNNAIAIIQSTAFQQMNGPNQVCGGLHSNNDWPNNHYGHGRIDAYNCLNTLINGKK